MERQLEPQSLNLNPNLANDEQLGPLEASVPRIGLAVLVLLMLMPWVWVSLGLLVFGDYRLTIVIYEMLGCALPLMLLGYRHIPLWPLRVNLGWILGLSIALGAVIITVYLASGGFGMNWTLFYQQAVKTKLSMDDSFWVFAIVIGLINPFLEEAFWRGLIYQGWKDHVGTGWARWISSFFFGAWHWVVLQHFCNPVWAVVLTLLVMVGGMTFCMLYERTKSLGSSVLLHGLGADFPMIFVVYDCVMNHSNFPH
jgi:membrane protease YdiL (CAAX protease family)